MKEHRHFLISLTVILATSVRFLSPYVFVSYSEMALITLVVGAAVYLIAALICDCQNMPLKLSAAIAVVYLVVIHLWAVIEL